MKRMIALDGAQGEGGGQILRSALSLSMITGQPFTITGIRAGRAKPGLLRQHLTAVKAAAEICRATVEGAELGSQRLVFRPGTVRGGDYRFAIGSAGSCTLKFVGQRWKALSWGRSVWSSDLAPCAAAITALLSVAPEVVRWCCKRCCPRCGLPMDLRVLK